VRRLGGTRGGRNGHLRSGWAENASFVKVAWSASFIKEADSASFVKVVDSASFVKVVDSASFVKVAKSARNGRECQFRQGVIDGRARRGVGAGHLQGPQLMPVRCVVVGTLVVRRGDAPSWAPPLLEVRTRRRERDLEVGQCPRRRPVRPASIG
jgi:hypothetical protein